MAKGEYDDRTALLLSAIDMEQVLQAAEMLRAELRRRKRVPNDHQKRRALETAIAVAYVRTLRGNPDESYVVPTEHQVPQDPTLSDMHAHLVRVRNKAYAHTDRTKCRRTVSMTETELRESWEVMIAESDLPAVVALAQHQRDRFREVASTLPASPDEGEYLDRLVAGAELEVMRGTPVVGASAVTGMPTYSVSAYSPRPPVAKPDGDEHRR